VAIYQKRPIPEREDRREGLPRAERPAWCEVLLNAIAGGAVVSAACKQAGITRSQLDDMRERDVGFAAAYRRAYEEGIDVFEAELRRRAVEGDPVDVFRGGKRVGTMLKKSDMLLQFLLKGRRPEVFGDKLRQTQEQTVCVRFVENWGGNENVGAQQDRAQGGTGADKDYSVAFPKLGSGSPVAADEPQGTAENSQNGPEKPQNGAKGQEDGAQPGEIGADKEY
jgi:hypothetical protein